MDEQFPYTLTPVASTRTKTFYYVLGSLLLAVGEPLIVAFTQPGARFYLLQPIIYVFQPLPFIVAAALWLPWGSERARTVGLVLARLLFIGTALLYVPQLTGLVPTGGDMIGLSFILFALVTMGAVLVMTAVGFGASWFLGRRAKTPPYRAGV
jgi:hypothetical protein